ncbi:extracellular catalytic domain type 1 short-chain-length polyhydroxyalkanoate depolymerase [Duganella aceris]|jgi:poly(hydroxyalkanoate) depolymerase family esterase|uniref:PHB depolymerase family esterase n=1 Tax=Duganella aceris TaxID=2703883 RepID=A0ABX0FFZ0_9BURK|nr:PHB depolymerase family esterase [Duganella aceris]NGZ83450.1 PHB depolymerase family esterase [Duganella aceris]
MKLPFLNNMRDVAQKLQQTMQAVHLHRPPAPATQPAMRDINPPPPNAAPRSESNDAGTPPQHQATAPNPATNPTEYAQDMLNRMGIKIDLQANIDRAIDVGTVSHPAAALPEGAQFIRGSYSNHAGSRNYKLYIPSSYHGQAMPLLVMLHGCTQNPDDFAAGTQMNQLAEEMEWLVAYPEQTANHNQSKCWNWFNAIDQQHGQGEPSIIAGIAQQIIDEYPVNERQVYVAGLSAGGAMAVIVGTLYPELFAAVGVHSGLPFASAQDLPSALSAMKRGAATAHKGGNSSQPIIVFHGDSDTTVNPRNGEQVIEQRLNSHKDARPSVQSGAVPNGHRYTQTTHVKKDGTAVGEHWVVHGAGHAWSGGSAHGSYTDAKGPDASREMLRFFSTVA